MPSIQPLDEADLELVTDIIHWAKLSLTINHLLWNQWPNKEAQREQTAQHVEHSFRDPNIRMMKASDNASGALLGFIVLTPRLSTEANESAEKPHVHAKQDGDNEKRPKLSDQLNPQILALITNSLSEITKAMTRRSYIEITSINVTQPSRNKGVGRQLMTSAFEYARSQGLPLFVTSEPQAEGFFAKLGMQEVQHADMELSEYAPQHTGFGRFRMIGMVWPPKD